MSQSHTFSDYAAVTALQDALVDAVNAVLRALDAEQPHAAQAALDALRLALEATRAAVEIGRQTS